MIVPAAQGEGVGGVLVWASVSELGIVVRWGWDVQGVPVCQGKVAGPFLSGRCKTCWNWSRLMWNFSEARRARDVGNQGGVSRAVVPGLAGARGEDELVTTKARANATTTNTCPMISRLSGTDVDWLKTWVSSIHQQLSLKKQRFERPPR